MTLNGENNKVYGVSSGSILSELFFQPTVRSQILFLDRRFACTGFFFLTHMDLRDVFFKITHPLTAYLRSKMVDPLLQFTTSAAKTAEESSGASNVNFGKISFRKTI